MTQQIERKPVVADKYRRVDKSDAANQFNMVQGIRREIAEMLAAKRRGFSAEDYQLLGREGILHEDDRIELIDGEIVPMSPIGRRHAAGVSMLIHLLYEHVEGQAIVSAQNPIRLGDDTEPQPDIALLRPRDDFYASAHPRPDDILLLIEVADSSLERDRQKTAETYAKHRIPEVWIANLHGACVECYRNPAEGEYVDARQFSRGERISPALLPYVELAVNDILPQDSA